MPAFPDFTVSDATEAAQSHRRSATDRLDITVAAAPEPASRSGPLVQQPVGGALAHGEERLADVSSVAVPV